MRELILGVEIFEPGRLNMGCSASSMMKKVPALLDWNLDDVEAELQAMQNEGLITPFGEASPGSWKSTPEGRAARERLTRLHRERAHCLCSPEEFALDDLVLAIAATASLCEGEHRHPPTQALIADYLFDFKEELPASFERLEHLQFVSLRKVPGTIRQGKSVYINVDGLREYRKVVAVRLGLDQDACVLDAQLSEASHYGESPPIQVRVAGTAVDNRFVHHTCVGAGDFGEVWKATDSKLGREVAIKYVPSSIPGRTDALAHARALAPLNHPCVVVVYDVLEDVLQPETGVRCDAVVMEYVDGKSLDEWMLSKPDRSLDARSVCASVIDALEHLHTKQIAHGDLHQGNIMVVDHGAKVIDILASPKRSRAPISVQIERDRDDCVRLIASVLRYSGLDHSAFLENVGDRSLSAQRVALHNCVQAAEVDTRVAVDAKPGEVRQEAPIDHAQTATLPSSHRTFDQVAQVLRANKIVFNVTFIDGGTEVVRTDLLAIFDALAPHMQTRMTTAWAARAATAGVIGEQHREIKEDAELDGAFLQIFADLQAYELLAVESINTPMGRRPRWVFGQQGREFFAHLRRARMEAGGMPVP